MFDVAEAEDSVLPDLLRYRGPERRRADAAPEPRHWMAATLDEIDYGILLLDDQLRAVHVNHAASAEFDESHPLQLRGRTLCARRAQDVTPLLTALHDAARRGLRKQLTLGADLQRISVSVVPLAGKREQGEPVIMVMLGKRQGSDHLSIQSFASTHRLSPAETNVLGALCRGSTPQEIASRAGVAISTVRTQIGSIRQKTGARSIRGLLQQVAALPPLMCVLHGAGSGAMLAAA